MLSHLADHLEYTFTQQEGRLCSLSSGDGDRHGNKIMVACLLKTSIFQSKSQANYAGFITATPHNIVPLRAPTSQKALTTDPATW